MSTSLFMLIFPVFDSLMTIVQFTLLTRGCKMYGSQSIIGKNKMIINTKSGITEIVSLCYSVHLFF